MTAGSAQAACIAHIAGGWIRRAEGEVCLNPDVESTVTINTLVRPWLLRDIFTIVTRKVTVDGQSNVSIYFQTHWDRGPQSRASYFT